MKPINQALSIAYMLVIMAFLWVPLLMLQAAIQTAIERMV